MSGMLKDVDLSATGTAVLDAEEQARGILRNLNTIVDGLESHWKGQAREAFKRLNERFDKDTTLLLNALHAIGEQLGGNEKAYQANEDNQLNAFGGIESRLA